MVQHIYRYAHGTKPIYIYRCVHVCSYRYIYIYTPLKYVFTLISLYFLFYKTQIQLHQHSRIRCWAVPAPFVSKHIKTPWNSCHNFWFHRKTAVCEALVSKPPGRQPWWSKCIVTERNVCDSDALAADFLSAVLRCQDLSQISLHISQNANIKVQLRTRLIAVRYTVFAFTSVTVTGLAFVAAGWRCEVITIGACIGFHAMRLILRDAFFRSASSANALLKRKVVETWQQRPIWGPWQSDWSSLILTEEHYLLSAACWQTEICLWLMRIHSRSLKNTPTFSQRPSICRKKWSQGSKSNGVQRFTISRSALPMTSEAIHAFGCSYFSSLDLPDLALGIPSTYKERWGSNLQHTSIRFSFHEVCERCFSIVGIASLWGWDRRPCCASRWDLWPNKGRYDARNWSRHTWTGWNTVYICIL